MMVKLETMLQDSGTAIQGFWQNTALHHRDNVNNPERHLFREMHFKKVWIDA